MEKRDIKTVLIGIAVSALLHSGSVSAGDISNKTFSIKESKILSVVEGNKTFIEKDEINYFDSLDTAEELTTGRNRDVSAINVIHKNDKHLQFRKEVALHDDGHLELTVKMRFFPFTDNSAPQNIDYSFLMPIKLLDGMKFKAVTGRASSCKEVAGEFNSKMADGIIVALCRYIVLQGAGSGYTFDFNPAGPGARKDWCEFGEPVGYWNIAKKGEYIKFSWGTKVEYYGGIFAGKMLIYQGLHDFQQKHAQTLWNYDGAIKDGHVDQFTFGTTADITSFVKADCKKYSPERKWGWKDSSNLKMLKTDSSEIIDNCVFSPKGKVDEFIADIRPGCYLISIRCGHNTQQTGPFNISLNGKLSIENIETTPGETKIINLTGYIRAPETKLTIGFSGKNMWAVRSIIIQALIYQNEDYGIDRGLWIMDKLFSPEIK